MYCCDKPDVRIYIIIFGKNKEGRTINNHFEQIILTDAGQLTKNKFNDSQNATREPYKTLGDSLRRDPRLIIMDYPERLSERLVEYNGVFAQVNLLLLLSDISQKILRI